MTASTWAVPVIMFHSVGSDGLKWKYSFLSESIQIFKKKIQYLKEKGFNFIFHDDLYYYMKDAKPLLRKSIMLSFDDGYLDNWVVVFPILKKLGVKFTIYVSQNFADSSATCRLTLDDVWQGKVDTKDLKLLGYLSWAEMMEMEKSGYVDIQSHTSTHTWHFTGKKIIDFITPQNITNYPWIMWNIKEHGTPYWINDIQNSGNDLFGLPVYENDRAMVAVRYNESKELNEILLRYVRDSGGREFFNSKGWRSSLTDVVNSYREKNIYQDTFESEIERSERLRYELLGNRQEMEKRLDKEVRYLCWPGGAYNDELIKLAGDYGYWASTVKRGSNTIGDDPRFVHRISSGNPSGSNRFPWKYSLFTLQFYLSRFQRKYWALALDNIYRGACH